MKYITLASLLNFLAYALTGMGLLAAFTVVYNWVTPYNDVSEIRNGNNASSITLGGAMLGFTIPIVMLSYFGVNLADFVIWSAVVGAIQIGMFKLLSMILPVQNGFSNTAAATIFAVISVCIGLITGFSLIPH